MVYPSPIQHSLGNTYVNSPGFCIALQPIVVGQYILALAAFLLVCDFCGRNRPLGTEKSNVREENVVQFDERYREVINTLVLWNFAGTKHFERQGGKRNREERYREVLHNVNGSIKALLHIKFNTALFVFYPLPPSRGRHRAPNLIYLRQAQCRLPLGGRYSTETETMASENYLFFISTADQTIRLKVGLANTGNILFYYFITIV